MVSEKIENKTSYSLYDYYYVFVKYKLYILYTTGIFCIVSVILYFFIIDPLFLSTSTVKTTAKTGGLAGMLSATGLSGIGDVGDLAGGGVGASELALYENILNSRRCIEETIIKFGLMDQYNYKYMQDAVKNFREEILEISKDKIAGTLSIGIYDKSPNKAKEIVDFLIYQLNKINVELSVLNAKNNREFLEERFNQIKINLKNAEDSLKIYQDHYGIAPDVMVKAAVQSQIQIEANIKSEEIKLDLLRKILSPDQNEIKMQEEKISSMKKAMNEIKNSTDSESLLKIKGSPDIVLNYFRLSREVEIQNKIMIYILPIYEQAKIDEKKETPTVLILDQSFIPERKTKPKRLVMIIVITLAGCFLSYATFFVKDRIKDLLDKS